MLYYWAERRKQARTGRQEVHMLTLDVYQRSDHLLLRAHGELDLDSSTTFRERVADLAHKDCRTLVVDLSGLEFVDSCGLGALLATVRLPEEHRPLLVLLPSNLPVRRLLQTTRLDSLLGVYPSVEAALNQRLARSAA
jgi:anti-sigma B factor antagonist